MSKVSLPAFFSKKEGKKITRRMGYAPHGSAWSLNGTPITRVSREPKPKERKGLGRALGKPVAGKNRKRIAHTRFLPATGFPNARLRGLCVSLGLGSRLALDWRCHAARAVCEGEQEKGEGFARRGMRATARILAESAPQGASSEGTTKASARGKEGPREPTADRSRNGKPRGHEGTEWDPAARESLQEPLDLCAGAREHKTP